MINTEEEKKQLKAAFGRMLDNGEDFLAIDIAEVDRKDSVSPIKEGNVGRNNKPRSVRYCNRHNH